MTTKVAIPFWNGNVSPVMDTACRLMIVEIKDGREVSRAIVELPRLLTSHRAGFISDLGIDILICGAISQQFDRLLTASGVAIKPWYGGDVNEIMAAYLKDGLKNDSFLLPGCGRRRCRDRSRHGGRGNGWGMHKPYKED